MDNTEESPVIFSLCTGIRGLERGIERSIGQPLRVAAYAEIEALIIENLLAGMEAGLLVPAPIWTDLKTFPWESFHGKVHGIIGGYPCQPFSVAGNQKGEQDPRHLWPYISAGIRAIKPLWCFFENVPGHLNIGYETVRRELQEMGYHVEEGIFSAEEVGAPHRRERLFILAVLADASIERFSKSRSSGVRKLSEKERFYNRLKQSSNELGNATISYQSNEKQWSRFRKESIGRTGSELGNPYCSPAKYKISTRRPVLNTSSEKLANSNNKGLQGWECGELCECSGECTARTSSAWPARPGQYQYEWEEPRTIKSGLGCTINGYNFREDLLRAAGNGVVEQTAELAWDLLWEKQNRWQKK